MWPDRTGRGVRVAVVDSGIHPTHPHVGGRVDGGCLVIDDDAPGGDAALGFLHCSDEIVDRIGAGDGWVQLALCEKIGEVISPTYKETRGN